MNFSIHYVLMLFCGDTYLKVRAKPLALSLTQCSVGVYFWEWVMLITVAEMCTCGLYYAYFCKSLLFKYTS